MSIPYMIKVTSDKKDIKVKVFPQPIATKDEYLPVISKSVQNILINYGSKPNTIMNRSRLKNELTEILESFHKQGMIKPKENDDKDEEE